jgi:predicted alpha/beta superfamily hydrolase
MIFRTLFVVAAIAFTGCADTDRDAADVRSTATGPATDSAPITLGQSYTLNSAVYGGPREINLYVPDQPAWAEGYFTDPLPVLYVVDGGMDQDFVHIAALSQLPLVNGERSPAIIVGVKTDNRYGEITPDPLDPSYVAQFTGYGGAADFRQFLKAEVIPFVQAKGYKGRAALMGESLAGLFVIDSLAAEPDLFEDYIAISPSSWWDDQALAKRAVDALADTPVGKRLVLAIADEGGTMEAGTRLFMAAANANPAIEVTFLDRSDSESHGTIYHAAARDALLALHGIEAEPYGDTPWYLVEGENPPAEK